MTVERERQALLTVFVDGSALQASLGDPARDGNGVPPDEVQLLLLAEAYEHGYVEFVTTTEAEMEMRESRSGRRLLFGAPIAQAMLPPAYSQALAGTIGSDDVETVLRTLDAPRYRELRGMSGAEDPTRAHLIDALNLWCAEETACDVLLTCDREFQARAGKAEVGAVPVARAGEILEAIGNRIGRWRTFRFLMKGRKRVRNASVAR